MIALITGGSGSGKSEYAENYISMLSNGRKKYYLATMQAMGEEGKERVLRHRMLRAGKGFITIEQARSIQDACNKMESKDVCVLLECMSNLVANEMFMDDNEISVTALENKIIKDVLVLSSEVKDLVIVGNNVFEDGIVYDRSTMDYIQALGRIQTRLASLADEVIEVVVGIPVYIRKEKKEWD